MKILYIYRHPAKGISMGKVFKPIEEAMKQYAEVDSVYLPCANAKPMGLYRNICVARDAVKQKHYDVVHVTGDAHYLLPFLRKENTVCTVHDLGFVTNQRLGLLSLWHYMGWIYTLRFANFVTFISDKSKREAEQLVKLSASRYSTIQDPVSPTFQFCPKVFNQAKPVILHVGTKPNKNLNNTILALQSISCHLRIVGTLSADQLFLLQLYRIDYSQVQDITDEELVIEYQKCDIVNFPTFYEGFGMPIIEGQATGRLVVTSDLAPMNDVAGDHAVLVNPDDVDSIRTVYQRIISDESYRQSIIAAGCENVKRFRLSTIVGEYHRLYQHLTVCD